MIKLSIWHGFILCSMQSLEAIGIVKILDKALASLICSVSLQFEIFQLESLAIFIFKDIFPTAIKSSLGI